MIICPHCQSYIEDQFDSDYIMDRLMYASKVDDASKKPYYYVMLHIPAKQWEEIRRYAKPKTINR